MRKTGVIEGLKRRVRGALKIGSPLRWHVDCVPCPRCQRRIAVGSAVPHPNRCMKNHKCRDGECLAPRVSDGAVFQYGKWIGDPLRAQHRSHIPPAFVRVDNK